MNTIWKYPIKVTDEQFIEVPEGAQLLTVQMQAGVPNVWALVNPDNPKKARTLVMRGTGHSFNADGLCYLATFQMQAGMLVFHVFEKPIERIL